MSVPLSSKPAGDAPSAPTPTTAPGSTATNSMSVKAAGMIRPYLDKATPALVAAGNLVDVAEPYFFAVLADLQHVWWGGLNKLFCCFVVFCFLLGRVC
jgi:hypothetical protein